jgi:hypothetical protein
MSRTVGAAVIVVTIAIQWVIRLQGQTAPTPGRFIDATEQLGVHFRQQASPTTKKYLLETMGSGVGLFDYDNDGLIGETINIMTLGGLALAVGILVDDATVEVENINRNREAEPGKDMDEVVLHSDMQRKRAGHRPDDRCVAPYRPGNPYLRGWKTPEAGVLGDRECFG